MSGSRSAPPLPAGFAMVLDPDCRRLDERILFGGSPARYLRLSVAGQAALSELLAGPVRSPGARALGRRLTDAGLAHPRPPGVAGPADATVIIPVRDRPQLLERCLSALGPGHRVVVVDDGSADPQAVAAVAARYGASVLRRGVNGGPGAARNTGLAGSASDLIVFLDSDCVPPPGWIGRLAAHLADPLVAAVAPRVVAVPAGSWAGRYGAARGSLDMGPAEARVMPGGRVPYLPTAALVVRRAALQAVADGAAGVFDEDLRFGEDVDLIWRLHAAGWRIRYDPAVWVSHHEPQTWPALLARRFRYGTSAAPLSRRHPDAAPPLVLRPWPALAVAGLLARRPPVALACGAASLATTVRTVRRAGLPTRGLAVATARSFWHTWLGLGRYGTQFAAPALVAAALLPSRRTGGGRPGRRAAAALTLAAPALAAWAALAGSRPASRGCGTVPMLDPVRFALGHVADDVAYGAGVWAGCVRHRTIVPVRPVIFTSRRADPAGGAGPAVHPRPPAASAEQTKE